MTAYCLAPDCGATTVDAHLCTRCTAELRAAVKDIPPLMHEVSVLATGQARVYRRSGRPVPIGEEQADIEEEYGWRLARTPAHLRAKTGRVTLPSTPSMVNLAARDKLDAAWTTLRNWAVQMVRLGADRRTVPDKVTPASLGEWIADRITTVRHDPASAAVAHHELVGLRDQLRRLVARAPSRVYAGPCHTVTDGKRCNRPLYAWFNVWRANSDRDETDDDQRAIVCDGYRPANDPNYDPTDQGCGQEHTPQDRAEWIIAELEDRLDTLPFWQTWLPLLLPALAWPSRSTWWRWREANRLEVKSITRDADELFRGGDIIDLVIREQTRIRGNRQRARRAG